MGKVESGPIAVIEPPAGCKNFASCPPAQELVSRQQKILDNSYSPIESPTIRVHCESVGYEVERREIKVTSVFRFKSTGEAKMTVPQTISVKANETCSNR